jgi:hypothetical protein
MTESVTLTKISHRVTETSTVNCGWGIQGNGSTRSARWAATKSGEHVATLYSDNGVWYVVNPQTFRVFTYACDRPSGIRWIAANL